MTSLANVGAGKTVGGESLEMTSVVGHIMDIKCPCGYSTTVTPRSELSKEGSAEYVIAYKVTPYDAGLPKLADTPVDWEYFGEEGSFIGTVERKDAERRQLQIIENPSLNNEPQLSTPSDDGWGDFWGYYLCPKCEKMSLRIYHVGYMD